MTTYNAVRACAEVLLSGVVLQAAGVSAGNGRVIDWREVRSGETLQEGADAFDTAQLFVALVGADVALAATGDLPTPPPPFVRPAPRIHAWARREYGPAKGGRARTFEVRGFTVQVEPHEDDARQAEFTARLAALASANLEATS